MFGLDLIAAFALSVGINYLGF